MATTIVPTPTANDPMAELGVCLEHLHTILDLMTDMKPGDSVEAQKLHSASMLAFQLTGDAMGSLVQLEARA